MTYAAKLTAKLSPAAREALTNAGTSRQGATVPTERMAPEVILELAKAGLIGPWGGLTQSGTIAREHIQTEDLENLF